MENLLCIINLQSPYWNLVNFILAVFAVGFSIGYFLKPRLFFVGFIHDNKWKVRVINKNLIMAVKEVQCEIAVSENKCFRIEKTLQLTKDKTLVLKKFQKIEDDYIFKVAQNSNQIIDNHRLRTNAKNNERDYKYMRIRILALNFMGIRKYYERIYAIGDLQKVESGPAKPEPLSYCKHKELQRIMYQNLECDENT